MNRSVQELGDGIARTALRSSAIAASIAKGDHSPESIRDLIDHLGNAFTRALRLRATLESTTRIRRLR